MTATLVARQDLRGRPTHIQAVCGPCAWEGPLRSLDKKTDRTAVQVDRDTHTCERTLFDG